MKLSPMLAERLQPSATLLINEKVNQLWSEGKTVYHLGFGESRMPVHPKLLTALAENAHQKSYLAGQGLLELREAIGGFYSRNMGIPATSKQIMVGPGSKSLIYALQLAMDAELILPTPSWVSYAPQAELLGRPVRYIPGSIKDHYALTVDALEQTLAEASDKPKILLLNSPNNPSGQMLSESLLRDLAAYCREKQITVLSDEIYGMTAHGSKPHVSIAQFYPEGTVVLGGLSKHLSLGGWRLGVAVLPDTDEGDLLMQALRVIASETWSSPTAPIQYAAIAAYEHDPEITQYIADCTQLHGIRTRHLWSWLTELGIDCTEPECGFYMVANFDRWREPLAQKGVQTSTDLANYLLEEYQIATLPGTSFGIPAGELSLRLATSYLDMETDEKADAMMRAFRSGLDHEELTKKHLPMMNGALELFADFIQSL
ncbi:MAG: aminotransferase class I/II-fold pyridoxal phosphate-dependent enzyme [Chloroflexota bacterium]